MSKRKKQKFSGQTEFYETQNAQQAGMQENQTAQSSQTAAEGAQTSRQRGKTNIFFKLLLGLVLITVGIVVGQQRLFRLETVYVIGNDQKTPQQVVEASGLSEGMNMLGIREEDVVNTMAKDHALILLQMQKVYPDTIYLHVQERKTVAAMLWLGILYTLDGQGMVMTEESSAIVPAGMPVVTGLNAGSITVGRPLEIRDIRQLEAYQAIMYELQQQLYVDQVAGIDLSDPDNLYLVTVDGITARLGNAEYMEGKIGAIRSCMSKIIPLNLSGTLDVSHIKVLTEGENEAKFSQENAGKR